MLGPSIRIMNKFFGSNMVRHHEYQFLDFTAPISRTGITCIVPRPKRLAGWLLPVWPFSWKLWVAVFLAFAVGIFSLQLTKRLYIAPKSSRKKAKSPAPSLNNVVLIVGRMFLSQSVNLVVKRVPEMVILGCILLIGLMFGNTYSGGLAALMTVPQFEAPIDTPHQLAEQNVEWGATHDAWIFSILLATQYNDPILPVLKIMRTNIMGGFAGWVNS